jgi:hypothetical protein
MRPKAWLRFQKNELVTVRRFDCKQSRNKKLEEQLHDYMKMRLLVNRVAPIDRQFDGHRQLFVNRVAPVDGQFTEHLYERPPPPHLFADFRFSVHIQHFNIEFHISDFIFQNWSSTWI